MKRVITKLEWVGDHDILAAGFKLTLECGHTFFRPTNVIACDAIGKKLTGSEVFCKQCRLTYCNDDTFSMFHPQ